ncbi:MAG TPA: hypothetical protein PKI03_23045 [Pseudomonadota bacterium]|nr:hypothetical protein [Pseudomonadota bacterium]
MPYWPSPARRWLVRRLPLLAMLSLASCQRAGHSEPATRGGLLSDGRQLTRSEVMLQLVSGSHSEVATRLGPHRIESVTHYTVTPLSSPKAGPDVVAGFRADTPVQPYEGAGAWESVASSLEEKRVIELDEGGRLRLSNQNDHGYGIEAVVDGHYLYMRMQHAPFVRRVPEGDEVERLRALGYESGSSLLETVAHALYLSPPSETSRLGRPAWAVALSRQEGEGSRRGTSPAIPGKAWREQVLVEAIEGQAVVDRQRGTLLELRLSVRFSAPRGPVPAGTPSVEGERVQVEAQHELHVVSIGKRAEAISPPSEWIDPPMRPRPALDKQELLSGLTGGNGAGRP